MSIVDNAGTALGRKVGPLPLGGWAAIVVGAIVAVKLLKGGGSGSSGGSGGSLTIPDAFTDDGSSGGTLGGGGTTTTTPTTPVGSGTPAPAPAKYRLTIVKRTHFYSTLGKLVDVFGESGTYDATRVKIGTKTFYRIKRGGLWRLIPTNASTIKVVQT